jgi:hypothetical protein
MRKYCNKCKEEKEVSEFYKRKRGEGISGYLHICISCSRTTNRDYIKSDKPFDKKEYMKNYRCKNKQKLKNYMDDWRKDNADDIKEKRKEYYQNNKVEIKNKNYDYTKVRKKKDPLYKLTLSIRSLILISFKNQFTKKSKKTVEILGCSFEEFKVHLESQFDENMNWENHGTYWHMDHIKPISLAKNEKEVFDLNHYTNFQPLFWLDNLSKSNKYELD